LAALTRSTQRSARQAGIKNETLVVVRAVGIRQQHL